VDIRQGSCGVQPESITVTAALDSKAFDPPPLGRRAERRVSLGDTRSAPADLTVTGLAKALPYSWAEQESSIGFPQ
jgi:hypothetical protein